MSAVHNFIATDYDDALLRLVDLAVNNNAIAVAINAGGTGYTVGDILTVTGGTVVSSLTITLEVLSVAAGVIDGIRIFNCGAYSSNPGNPVAVTGGTGADDATFNLTFSTQNWVVNRNVANSTSTVNFPLIQSGSGGTQLLEREIQLQGPGNAGADEIYIGFLEVRDTDATSFSWHLAGFTGFGTLLDYVDQPGMSYVEPNEIPAFISLSGGAIECWFHVTPRTLKGVCRMGTTYTNFITGFLNPYSTPTEFPYPLYIGGSTGKWNTLFATSGVTHSGLCDPKASEATGGNLRGNAGFRNTLGNWSDVFNWEDNGTGSKVVDNIRNVYPCGAIGGGQTFQPAEDEFLPLIAQNNWDQLIPSQGFPINVLAHLFPTQDSGGDLTNLFATYVWERSPSFAIFGELDDVFWGSTIGANIVSEDRVIVGGDHFRAFQQGNLTDSTTFVFLREDA